MPGHVCRGTWFILQSKKNEPVIMEDFGIGFFFGVGFGILVMIALDLYQDHKAGKEISADGQ